MCNPVIFAAARSISSSATAGAAAAAAATAAAAAATTAAASGGGVACTGPGADTGASNDAACSSTIIVGNDSIDVGSISAFATAIGGASNKPCEEVTTTLRWSNEYKIDDSGTLSETVVTLDGSLADTLTTGCNESGVLNKEPDNI